MDFLFSLVDESGTEIRLEASGETVPEIARIQAAEQAVPGEGAQEAHGGGTKPQTGSTISQGYIRPPTNYHPFSVYRSPP